MGVSYTEAEQQLGTAVAQIFDSDPTVRAVGIGRHESGFGYRAVRNAAALFPLGGVINAFAALDVAHTIPAQVANIPVSVVDAPGEVRSLVLIPDTGLATPAIATTVPEVGAFRPLVAGLQIENFDDDTRQRTAGKLQPGFLIVGTLGCFVKLANGKTAILSNNHVVAAENHGKKNKDQIYQPGSIQANPTLDVAQLTTFKKIVPSPGGLQPPAAGVTLNEIDAGIAVLAAGAAFQQGYLPSRQLVTPHGTARASVGDRVFKVGRTTGLTRGTVTSVATVVGPVPYRDGASWFQSSIEIEGLNGTLFSDHGDSGSAIVRESGEIVGLLYAGNGQQTYACPIDAVFKFFKCSLA